MVLECHEVCWRYFPGLFWHNWDDHKLTWTGWDCFRLTLTSINSCRLLWSPSRHYLNCPELLITFQDSLRLPWTLSGHPALPHTTLGCIQLPQTILDYLWLLFPCSHYIGILLKSHKRLGRYRLESNTLDYLGNSGHSALEYSRLSRATGGYSSRPWRRDGELLSSRPYTARKTDPQGIS